MQTLSTGGDRWRIPPLAADEGRPSPNAPQPWNAEPGTRLRAFYEVWLALRALDAPTREAALDEIAEWAAGPRSSGRVLLTWEQVREFAALPGLSLGAHTLTHPALPTCSRQDARAEIAGGVDRLRAQTGVEVEQFAYPFGRVDGASPVWSPTSAFVAPTRPPEMRSRGARPRTRSHACRLRIRLRRLRQRAGRRLGPLTL